LFFLDFLQLLKVQAAIHTTVEVSVEDIETDQMEKNKMVERLPMIAYDELKNKPTMQKAISLDRSRNEKEISITQARA